MSIYTDCKAAGIETDNHYSDLYIPATPETRAILKKHNNNTASVFTNQVEGGLWFDVALSFDPYWEKRA